MSTLDDIRQTFFQECDDLLESLDDGLQNLSEALEAGEPQDSETVNAVFRAVHSIKGGAAAFGLETLVRFAHRFETALDDVRSNRLEMTTDVATVFLRAADQLADLVGAARENRPPASESVAQILSRLEALDMSRQRAAVTTTPDPEPDGDLAFAPMAMSFDFAVPSDPAGEVTYLIQFLAQDQLFANGSDPVHLFRELSDLGELHVSADKSKIEGIESLDASHCQLSWAIELTTAEPEAAIWEIFEFVDGLCQLSITLRESETEYDPIAVPGLFNLTEAAAETNAEPDPQDQPPPAPKTKQTEANAEGTGAKATVRVDLDHVDRMINVVGELVINQAVLTQGIKAANIPLTSALSSSLDEFMSLAREIQEGVMAIRAQSVKPLFQRMARIAREAGDLAGKAVRFDTEGEATEVDKTVIERLVSPLTHIIRNSVDHGIEPPEARKAAGKTEVGNLLLRAAHRSGRVIIEVVDDGAGINRPKVLEIAIKKGLVAHDAVLSNSDIDKLLFMPGFSTAPKVTDLSGRGVGMDVVRSSVQKLGGRIAITSEPGSGTTISISLPLTLAVLDGMVVDVSGHTMVVPIATIVETIRPKASDVHRMSGGRHVLSVRDRFIPIIDLGQVFGYRDQPSDLADLVYLLVENDHDKLWALAVDHIHDQRQVVIKGLENNYGQVRGVAAATILGDGKVALIIDPEEAALHSGTASDLTPFAEEI
ncbi:chemotaxis protein CheA [Cypionkella sp.]|uniref:chemotaxis protein CheA n=1 Tax=Cypionkella sp. TaxID=2811411 RepID=UPI002FDD267B